MTESLTDHETARARSLLDAQTKAISLYDEVVARGMVRPGVGERELSDRVRDLAHEMYGVDKHWHKRIVRGGPNTLLPYRENPPDRQLGEDDICFFDFGPVFEGWEADLGRTYVLGGDPVKHQLRDDLAVAFAAGRAFFDSTPDITGADLFAFVADLAREQGWEYGNAMAGHLVGEFPHERILGDEIESYIAPENSTPMRGLDVNGEQRHWILEIHLIDREREIGGFYEQLLTL